MNDINWNEVAWNAPNHDGDYGYLPSDEMYPKICEWLKSGEVLWEAKGVDDKGRKVTSKRIAPEGWDNYDVIADYTHETKMVSYIFRKKNTFVV